MTIETTATGTIVISDIVQGYRQQQKYIGYTMTEAKKLFKEWVKKKSNGRTKRDSYSRKLWC